MTITVFDTYITFNDNVIVTSCFAKCGTPLPPTRNLCLWRYVVVCGRLSPFSISLRNFLNFSILKNTRLKCGADITWSCGYTGKGSAHCSNSSQSSRIFELDSIHTIKFCDWHGYCERRPDGKVEIYYYSPI